MKKHHPLLFLNGFGLIVLATINTWQLAHERYYDSLLFGFLSALVWTFNVKRIAFSSVTDRIIYATGAAVGSLAGLELVKIFYHIKL